MSYKVKIYLQSILILLFGIMLGILTQFIIQGQGYQDLGFVIGFLIANIFAVYAGLLPGRKLY